MNRRQGLYLGRFGLLALAGTLLCAVVTAEGQVRTESGIVEAAVGADPSVRAFKGIPYAAPPVGDLRWREPQPVKPWKGALKSEEFGPRAMQAPIYADMIFRDKGPSEDCLYLNVWTPAKSPKERFPVMVWIHGGGFQAGASSEPRQDGGALAKKGVVVVSMNYRMGVFGFLAHPELTKESGRGASGNYGLLDQVAALRWVQRNIAAFGGDPKNVTIFGESAGSFSVSALVASPLAKGLFAKAIGQSGAFFSADGPGGRTLAESEAVGTKLAASVGAPSLAALRAMPADALLAKATADQSLNFWPNVDGYFLPQDVPSIYAAGAQSRVPLLAGWNADEIRVYVTFGPARPTAKSFVEQTRTRFGPAADRILELYPAATDEEAVRSAGDLASDLFIGYATWKWIQEHSATSRAPVYVYLFDRKIPVAPDTKVNGVAVTGADVGARHAGEIEYVFGTLDSVPNVTWTSDDRRLSEQMMTYWTNFARAGNPSGRGLPAWPRYERKDGYQVMHLDVESRAVAEMHRARFEYLSSRAGRKPAPAQ